MAELVARGLQRTLGDGRRRFRLRIPAFRLESGDRLAIVGETGSGKTTAMDVLALACRPDAATDFSLSAGNTLVDLLAPHGARTLARLRARHFGYVLQTSPLFPFLDLGENAELGQRLAGRRDPDAIRRLLAALRIDLPLRTRIADLSVGQRQRLAVVRALAHRPDFLLCDEPTGALDPRTAGRLLDTLIAEAGDTGAAILMITHDEALAASRGFTTLEMVRDHGRADASTLRPAPGAVA
ncbi:ABC transporter ATP-binding protein [Methylobrevis pamukkalensis]|uniref:ABC transporter ATP-binding protein YxdL n=1 Tax=Methylobrevis pamukkalensis TaxID=1439726 RepID=A0A1E3H2Z7_9HYPH|nr:ABC transporter ATP-binding protein [Methylobrevis pamukkalensis]ODN70703.1 ABC transporter ATP-binding protein YxdL [Methylobrevis pamukkalensis]